MRHVWRRCAALIVLPRGSNENPAQCKERMAAQKKCKLPLMPASPDETEHDFRERLAIARTADYVVHAYDGEREDRRLYERRREPSP